MAILLAIPIEYILLFLVGVGMVLVGHPVSKGFVGWLAEKFVNLPLIGPLSLKQALRLNEWISNQLSTHVAATGGRVAHWFTGIGQAYKYNRDLSYRQALAVANLASWVEDPFHKLIVREAVKQAEGVFTKNQYTKAPPLPQRRITQKEADEAFKKLIESEFAIHLKEDFPQFEWKPKKWRKWLGIAGVAGGSIVIAPAPPTPQVQPIKKAKAPPKVKIGPPQPTTLPRTDQPPHPQPGTQLVPGVISGKDEWARGQIVRLKKYEESTRKHLGPLALLALPAAAIGTLIGLIECKNFGRFGKALCSLPSNLFNDLLALLTDFLVLTNICTVIPWLEDAADVVLPFITEFTTGAAALACASGHDQALTLTVPTLQLPASPIGLPALQLP